MKKTALIMAGGKGERFWPKSRLTLPKQFLSLTNDGKTMIQLTVERILPLVDMEDIYIATNETYRSLVREQLPDIPESHILCEPVGRNTAPCIGLGAVHIHHKYEDAVMIVLPSDHLVKYNDIFTRTLEEACRVAESGENLVTLGIAPNYPETGYGYIKADTSLKDGDAFRVDRFVEKPDLETARSYVESGDYYWNSGMFIWKISSILSALSRYMPETYDGLSKIGQAVGTENETDALLSVFPTLPSESIDYGIMEKASHIYLVPGVFGWDDVGSWLAVERVRGADDDGNTLSGNVTVLNTSGCTIEAREKLIAAIGLNDLIVVDTDDALLICAKDSAGDIKKMLELLRNKGKDSYL